jgi:hypothetical protein
MADRRELTDQEMDEALAEFVATATPEEKAWLAEMDRDFNAAFDRIDAMRAAGLIGDDGPDDLPEAPAESETIALFRPPEDKPDTPRD